MRASRTIAPSTDSTVVGLTSGSMLQISALERGVRLFRMVASTRVFLLAHPRHRLERGDAGSEAHQLRREHPLVKKRIIKPAHGPTSCFSAYILAYLYAETQALSAYIFPFYMQKSARSCTYPAIVYAEGAQNTPGIQLDAPLFDASRPALRPLPLRARNAALICFWTVGPAAFFPKETRRFPLFLCAPLKFHAALPGCGKLRQNVL